MEHEYLKSETDPEYWDFSFSEIGLYDLPAMVGYIYDQSNQHALTYIGHSQGSTAMFYGLAHDDDAYLADKLKEVLILSPCFVISKESDLNPIGSFV